LNLLFFTSVSLGDGLSLKSRDQEGGRSRRSSVSKVSAIDCNTMKCGTLLMLL
jgi:hypothetical protein